MHAHTHTPARTHARLQEVANLLNALPRLSFRATEEQSAFLLDTGVGAAGQAARMDDLSVASLVWSLAAAGLLERPNALPLLLAVRKGVQDRDPTMRVAQAHVTDARAKESALQAVTQVRGGADMRRQQQ
jgi:hypothetical protein